jgi:hypothetical protein
VAVVLNSGSFADDAASLLDHAFADESWARRPAAPRASATATVRLGGLRADLDAAADAPSSLATAVARAGSRSPAGARRGPS